MTKRTKILFIGIIMLILIAGCHKNTGKNNNLINPELKKAKTENPALAIGNQQSYSSSVFNDKPIILTGNQTLEITDTDYKHKNDITLRDNSQLIIRNSKFDHKNDYSFQYWLNAYDNSKVVIENSQVISSPWVNWDFHDNSSLQMNTVDNSKSGIWHGFQRNAKAEINTVRKFYGTLNDNSIFNIRNAEETFIELLFHPGAIIDEQFPSSIDSYEFPNTQDKGFEGKLIIKNSKKSNWGITYNPDTDVTIRNTDSLVVTYGIPPTYSGITAEFNNLKSKMYADETWTTGRAKLHLINTKTEKWSPIVSGNNKLIIRNSELADNAFSFGNAEIIIENSSMTFLRGNDNVKITAKNSVVNGDVVAMSNSIITLENTKVYGKSIQENNGKIITN